MKDDEVSELLIKVENALWIGDQRAAGILLHQILLQDFTNRQAWQLLHSMRGGELTLKEFQRSFAQRYYPHLAHLLDDTPPPLGGFGWEAEPIAPAFKPLPAAQPAAKPVKPFVEPIEEYDETEEGEASFDSMEPLTPAGKPLFDVPEPVVRTGKVESRTNLPPAEMIEAEVEAVEAEAEPSKPAGAEGEGAEATKIGMQICPGCGVTLNGTEEFCTYCGIHLAALQQLMPPAGETRGAEELPFCAACGKTYPAHAHFCDRCGAALVRPSEAAKPAQAPPQAQDPDTQPVPAAIQASAMAAESPKAQQATLLETEQAAPQVDQPVELPQASLPVAVAAGAAAVAAGTLTITRENSSSGALFKYTIWIDGKEGEKISNNKRKVLSLAAGHHTIQITKGKRASLPLAIEVKPGGNVQLYCQPPKTKTSGPRVFLLSASRPTPVKTRWWAGYLLLLTILACLAAGIGTVVYYFMVIAD